MARKRFWTSYRRIVMVFVVAALMGFSLNGQCEESVNAASEHEAVIQRFVKTSLTDQQGYRWLEELCAIGPRLTGSENLERAIELTRKILESSKVDRVWLQPVQVPMWTRGIEQATITRPRELSGHKLSISALGRSVGTDGKEVAAPVVEVKDIGELKALGDAVLGKIVFFNKPFPHAKLSTFSGYGSVVRNRLFGVDEAAKLGALAVIVRSITTKKDNIPHTGTLVYRDNVKQIPGVAIGLQDADFLSAQLKKHGDLTLSLTLGCKMHHEITSYNVIGEITGTEHPDDIVVVGGHIDSWDQGCGAHDDASGCIHAMEALSLFKRLGIRPKRTIRCVLFVSEEYGGHGGRAYAEEAEKSTEHQLAAIESDRGGFTPRGFTVEGDTETIAATQQWVPLLRRADIDWIRKGGSGTDVEEIENVRARFGLVVDSQRYFDVHHSANDVFRAVNARELELGSAAMASLAYLISEEGLPAPAVTVPEAGMGGPQ